MQPADLVYRIALGLIPGIGDVTARKLVSHTGSPEAVFRENYGNLIKIPGIGDMLARAVTEKSYLKKAEAEADFITRKKITPLFYLDDNYPKRLSECDDSPVMMYYKGNADIDAPKMLSIVGTRKATPRGRELCENIISGLATLFPDLIIVSGLAYGIDITAHKAALDCGLKTIGILAHGMKTIYPPAHRNIARDMLTSGGLLTDFISDAPAERNNFLKRNRIIAGLSGAILVVESGVKGGALVTAEMALSYSRDVMAVPGRPSDNWSAGCNRLIKRNIAALVENAGDICEFLNWTVPADITPRQAKIFCDLTPEEEAMLKIIRSEEYISLDSLSATTAKPVNEVTPILLALEMNGLITCLPGNIFKLKLA